jgi:PBSX family phage terminase large subunit
MEKVNNNEIIDKLRIEINRHYNILANLKDVDSSQKNNLKNTTPEEIFNEAVKVIPYELIESTDVKTLTTLLFRFTALQVYFLLNKDKKYNILSGSVRSGKTYVTLFKYGLKIINSPKDTQWLIAAYTVTSLERNCLKLLENFFGRKNFTYSITHKKAWLYGREIYLEGAPNDASKKRVQGLTLNGVYLDEVQNLPRAFVDMCMTRLSEEGAFAYMTCNPENPKHWFYINYILKNTLEPFRNYYVFLLDHNKFLPKSYIEEQKATFSGVFFQRMILGLWKAAEGVVFTNFANNTEDFIIDEINKDEIDFIILGLDFGGNKSKTTMVATAFYKDKNKGFVAVKSDFIPGGKGEIDADTVNSFTVKFYRELHAEYESISIPYFFCDSAEQTLINSIRKAFRRERINVKIGDALKIKINDRIRFLSSMMNTGRFKVLSCCKTVVDCLQELVWNAKELTDVLLDDGTTDNDTWDGLSYTFERFIQVYS